MRRRVTSCLLLAAVCVGACNDPDKRRVVVAPTTSPPVSVAPSPSAPSTDSPRHPSFALRDLHVTTGRVIELSNGRLHVVDPTTRFVARGTAAAAEMHFTYRGPTARSTHLSSGEMRRQLGLKLRARDGCNVVYAMWRLEPELKLVVSVKRNEGASTHDECGAGGYENITPSRSAQIPTVVPGEPHVLAARIEGTRMRVTIDTREVWEGALPRDAFAFNGPGGVRTDNVDVDLDFSAGQ